MNFKFDKSKPIRLSGHAQQQMIERGILEEEVREAVRIGEISSAKKGRLSARANFSYQKEWRGRNFRMKQVKVIFVEEEKELVIITTLSYYF